MDGCPNVAGDGGVGGLMSRRAVQVTIGERLMGLLLLLLLLLMMMRIMVISLVVGPSGGEWWGVVGTRCRLGVSHTSSP